MSMSSGLSLLRLFPDDDDDIYIYIHKYVRANVKDGHVTR